MLALQGRDCGNPCSFSLLFFVTEWPAQDLTGPQSPAMMKTELKMGKGAVCLGGLPPVPPLFIPSS